MKILGKDVTLAKIFLYVKQHVIYFKLRIVGSRISSFVQIGVGEGKDIVADLANKHGWSGHLVEPDDVLFTAKEEYRRLDVQAHKMAIADHDGTIDFFCASDTGAGRTIVEDFGANKDKELMSTSVECLKLSSFLKKNNISSLGLLAVDVEGYDGKIIQQLLETQLRPSYIIYESKHLTADEHESVLKALHGEDYRTITGLLDTLAVRR